MKIAFIVGAFPCLSETFILNQIIGLIERGHDVDIYATRASNGTEVQAYLEKYNLQNHIYYCPQIPSNYLLRVLKGLGLWLAYFPRNPAVLLGVLNVFKYGKKAASLRLLHRVIPLLRGRSQYDIIQCHFGTSGLRGMELRDIGAIQGRLCTTFHGFDISVNLQKFGDQVYSLLFDKGDLFLPISECWKHQLIRLGCAETKIVVHRMGVDCQRFTFTPRHVHPHSQLRLVTVARLVEKKGVEYGIRAIAKLSKIYQDVEYNIVGDGDLRESLERLIHELDVGATVKLLGWKQGEEIPEILHRADILLAPSVTSQDGDQEGIPVVLMEAMATGMPVVSTQHSGIPELVEDGVSGFLIPERDIDTLVEKLSYLIEHPEIWPEMGRNGRLKVEEFHNVNKLNNRLINLYQQLKPISQLDSRLNGVREVKV